MAVEGNSARAFSCYDKSDYATGREASSAANNGGCMGNADNPA